jgi:hypothetical protein
MRRSRAAALALVVVLAPAALAAGSELYGKPLRGLSAVSVAAVVERPDDYAGKTIRVSGANKGEKGRPALAEKDAVLPLETDGFSLPEDLAGARLTAEGRVTKGDKGAVFVATGVEVRR